MPTRLEQEVWALGRCAGCGACVAVCNKGVLYWGDAQQPLLETRQKTLGLTHILLDACSFCPVFCEASCPRLDNRTPLLARRTVSARAIEPMPRGPATDPASAEPNGVIRNLLVAARSAGLIDGAIMMDMDPWSLEPRARVAITIEQIVDSLGFQGLWAPALDALNEALFDYGLHDLAVVGTPCVAEAARKLQTTEVERLGTYRDAIRLIISNFCTGAYLPSMVAELLEQEMGVTPDMIRRLRAAPDGEVLTLTLSDGTEREIPSTAVEPFTRHGCARCHDYLGGWADVAVGPVGAKEGYVTLITRSRVGDRAVDSAIRFKLLEVVDEVDTAALERASAEKGRRERARAFDELTIMMLDALADRHKRAEVRAQFGRLYKLPPQPTKPVRRPDGKEEAIHAGCSGCYGC